MDFRTSTFLNSIATTTSMFQPTTLVSSRIPSAIPPPSGNMSKPIESYDDSGSGVSLGLEALASLGVLIAVCVIIALLKCLARGCREYYQKRAQAASQRLPLQRQAPASSSQRPVQGGPGAAAIARQEPGAEVIEMQPPPPTYVESEAEMFKTRTIQRRLAQLGNDGGAGGEAQCWGYDGGLGVSDTLAPAAAVPSTLSTSRAARQ